MIKYMFFLLASISMAQIGINTTDPKGSLHVESINNMGIVLPRVDDLDFVTDGAGNPPMEGTLVFYTAIPATCFYQNGGWVCIEQDASGNPILSDRSACTTSATYVKASNTQAGDAFGSVMAISDDGNTLAVATHLEDSNASGINGNGSNNSFQDSGAAYIFVKSGSTWIQQAYIKASNPEANDSFGISISLSGDGNTLAVGAVGESSNATGVNGNQSNNSSSDSGATYIFTRSGSIWSQQAYIKASNTETTDLFGRAVSLSYNGNKLAVGATGEDSNSTGVNGNQTNNSTGGSGAVYLFSRSGSVWTQTHYIKSSNPNAIDSFGNSLEISGDGNTLVIGALFEDSNATGINGNQANNSAFDSGAAYVFYYNGSNWAQQAYLKASNTEGADAYGHDVSISSNGDVVAVGAIGEDSNATGINGNQANNSAQDSGAVYLYVRNGTVWSQEAYIKSSNSETYDDIGNAVSLSNDGNVLLVSTYGEDSNGTGLCSDGSNNNAVRSGAAYVFKKIAGSWSQTSFIKATNTEAHDQFGQSSDISGNGVVIAVGANGEASNAVGINGNQANNSAGVSGAVYIFGN